MRLKQGLIRLPDGVDIVTFMRFDGSPPVAPPDSGSQKTTLAVLRDRDLATHAGSLESNALYIARIHFQHLIGLRESRWEGSMRATSLR